MGSVYPVSVNGFCSVCLPWLSTPTLPSSFFPLSCRRQRVWGLSFTLLHFSLSASQAGSRSTDQGLGLPGLHYQLPATGTHCSWQTQGRGTPHRKSCSGKKGGAEEAEVFPQPQQPGPVRNLVLFFFFTMENFLSVFSSAKCLMSKCVQVGWDLWVISHIADIFSDSNGSGVVPADGS